MIISQIQKYEFQTVSIKSEKKKHSYLISRYLVKCGKHVSTLFLFIYFFIKKNYIRKLLNNKLNFPFLNRKIE